jgi:hypothetical protein
MTTFINPHEQVARLEERIEKLEAAIETIHTVRLNWALACPCKCHECDILFEAIRDVLPDSETETFVEPPGENPICKYCGKGGCECGRAGPP